MKFSFLFRKFEKKVRFGETADKIKEKSSFIIGRRIIEDSVKTVNPFRITMLWKGEKERK